MRRVVRVRVVVVAALLAGLLAGCGAVPKAGGTAEPAGVTALGVGIARTDPQPSEQDLRSLTAGQVAFALDLFRRQAQQVDGDLAIGPGSLHTALSMILAGARGRTATEMEAVLHTSGLGARLHELNNALDRELRRRGEDPEVDVSIANRLWAARGLALRAAFIETLASQYGAALAQADFAGDPEGSRAAVNQWVADNTRDKIEELFPKGTIDQSTQLVLANAIHLDAKWKFPFPVAATRVEPFTLPDGNKVNVEMMHYDEYLPSGRGDGWTAVRLPYGGDQLSMTVVVPDDLRAFEKRLDPALLVAIDGAIKDGGIHLGLPRFTAKTHLALADTLAAMGMPSAFGGGADFSGMTGSQGLVLAAVEHEVLVKVDEEGTEAAAASGGAMAGSHGPTVTVDRPFLFVIRDEPTGAVMFLGRVADPRT